MKSKIDTRVIRKTPTCFEDLQTAYEIYVVGVDSLVKEFHPLNKELTYDEVMNLDNQTFKEQFAESPINRTKLKGLQRNVKFLFKWSHSASWIFTNLSESYKYKKKKFSSYSVLEKKCLNNQIKRIILKF